MMILFLKIVPYLVLGYEIKNLIVKSYLFQKYCFIMTSKYMKNIFKNANIFLNNKSVYCWNNHTV